jgi:hypothetical protein
VRRFGVGIAVAAEDGLQVIDADEQHIRLRRICLSGEGQCGKEDNEEKGAAGIHEKGEAWCRIRNVSRHRRELKAFVIND